MCLRNGRSLAQPTGVFTRSAHTAFKRCPSAHLMSGLALRRCVVVGQRLHTQSIINSEAAAPSLAHQLAEEWAPQAVVQDQHKVHTSEAIIPLLTPKQLSSALWSCAKLKLKPSEHLLAVIAQEVQSKLPQFRSKELCRTLGALSMLDHQPDTVWWQAFELQVDQNLGSFSDRDLANLLWSFAALGHRNALILDHLMAAATDLSCFTPDSLHLVIWSLGRLSYSPSKEWVQDFLDTIEPTLFQLTPAQMVDVVWALARIGAKVPTEWLDKFLTVAQWRFPNFSASLLSTLGWSVATLGHRPSQEWVLCFEEQTCRTFLSFSAQELACTAWTLQQFGSQDKHNAVFCMLYSQEFILGVDFEILSNCKLMSQVLQWWRETG